LRELELFKAVDRTTRQEECRKTWIKNKCVGTIVAATGFGGQTQLYRIKMLLLPKICILPKL